MPKTAHRRGRNSSVRGNRRTFSKSAPRRGKSRVRSSQSRRPRNRGPRRSTRGTGRKLPTFNPSQFINTNPVDTVEEVYTPKNRFGGLGLDTRLVRTITASGLKTPTPIQDQIIPEILKNRDVIGLAETGTGKTAAFLIPLIEATLKDSKRQTLILAPTRELALQIEEELRKLSRGMRIYSTVCVGGMNIRPQIRQLRRPNHFIIGTPGRMLDLLKRKCFKPERTTTVVLDEADRMLDMGFIHDMRAILSATPDNRETLFFSATMPAEARKLVHDFLSSPVEISVKKKDVTDSIAQDVVHYEQHTKFETLLELLEDREFTRVIIFGSMKHSVEKLARQLSHSGIKSESIHGNKSHSQRQRSLKAFKDGKALALVATDVAARGIHVEDVSHVINYDLPGTFEDYVHRIGRTGRGSKRGKALTFVPSR